MTNIDMKLVARSITYQPATPVCEPVEITNNIKLHRFDEDRLHILVDGGGGYKAFLHPHTPHEQLVRDGHLSDFEDLVSGDGSIKDREVFVTLPGSPNDWTVWHLSHNLTDRWGELNYYNSHAKPLKPLEDDTALFERLISQMWDELTFIVRKDGQYGILFECEFISQESEVEPGNELDPDLKPHAEMIRVIDAAICELAALYPGVEFAIPDEGQLYNGRPTIWAFVKDGLLDEQAREHLGSFMLQI